MTMMLPLGVTLAWQMNWIPVQGSIIVLVWLLSAGWLAMVIHLHTAKPSPGKTLLTGVDFWFRLVLSLALIGTGLAGVAGAWTTPAFVAWKLAIFGGLIGCGLIVRIKLKDFGPAFAAIASGNVTEDVNAAIQRSLGGTRPFVILIWIGLLTSAALGIHLI